MFIMMSNFFSIMGHYLHRRMFILLASFQRFSLKFSYPYLLSCYKFKEREGCILTAANHYVTKRLIRYYIRYLLTCFRSMSLSMALHFVCTDSFHCKLALFTKVYFRKYFKNAVRGLAKAKAYY